MKNKVYLILFIVFIGLIFFAYTIIRQNNSQKLISPSLVILNRADINPTPSATPTPIEFNFDKTTDLRKELYLINPEVKDSDFEDLKQVIMSF